MKKVFFTFLLSTFYFLLSTFFVLAATFDSNLLPGNDNQYDIGSISSRWKNISISNLLNLSQISSSSDPIGAQNGSIYYNTTTNKFRGFASSTWTNFGSGYWSASDNAAIYYNSGNVGVGTSTPNNLFQVYDLISFPSSTKSTFLGYQAGKSAIGANNTFVGYGTGYQSNYINYGNYNTAVGNGSFRGNQTGESNVVFGGSNTFNIATSSNDNVIIGNNISPGYYGPVNYNVLVGNTINIGSNSDYNIVIGDRTMEYISNNRHFYNIVIGQLAMRGSSNSSSTGNIAIGNSVLGSNITGSYNIAIGDSVLGYNTAGNYNIALGRYTMYVATSTNYNIAVGGGAISQHKIGAGNLAIGGKDVADNLVSGSNNIIIGYDINTPGATVSNQLNIANIIFGTDLDGIGTTISSGKIGIATTTPQSTLHIPDNKYFQAEDNNAGVPPIADCDSDLERGRLSIDTLNVRLYVCNGATRGWDYIILTN